MLGAEDDNFNQLSTIQPAGLFVLVDKDGKVILSDKDVDRIARRVIELIREENAADYAPLH